MAVCGQNFEWLTASTSWPSARSLSPTYAVGVRQPGRRAVGVIVGQAQDLQARHVTLGLEALQLGDEARGALHVRVAQIPAAIPLVDVAAQGRHARGAGGIG